MSAALDWSEQLSSWARPSPGERRAQCFTELARSRYEKAHPRLARNIRRIVYKRLSAHEDREDAIQDILFQVFQRIHTLRDPRCIEVWAARIAFNMVNAHLRRRRRHGRHHAAVAEEGSVTEDWDGKLLAANAMGVVSKLPPRDRELFCRACFSSVKWTELAREAGCSEATIKRRVRRARLRFDRLAQGVPGLAERVQGA